MKLAEELEGQGRAVAKEQINLEFQKDHLYYPMVTAYMSAICGLLIFRDEFKFADSVKAAIACTLSTPLLITPKHMKEIFAVGGFTLGAVSDQLAMMLVNAAFEATKVQYTAETWLELRCAHPELEFFRHLRNAASHGARWSFQGKEPTRHAAWRGKELDASMDGQAALNDDLQPGDLLVLLHDVEEILTQAPPADN